MKQLKFILVVCGSFILTLHSFCQDNTVTPEYEATRQTEKLQQELNLSPEQLKLVYEINLRYARARQNSTSRSESMERIKKKDEDMEKVLTPEQMNKLRNKRYERSVYNPSQRSNYRPTEGTSRSNVSPSRRTSGSQMKVRDTNQNSNSERRTDSQESRRTNNNNTRRSSNTYQNRPRQSTPTTTNSSRSSDNSQGSSSTQRRSSQPSQNSSNQTDTRRR